MTEPIRIRILTHGAVPFRDHMGHYRNAVTGDEHCDVYTVTEMVEAEPVESELRSLREKVARYEEALERISDWRNLAHEYDEDAGNGPRDFDDEDWDMVENCAKDALNT